MGKGDIDIYRFLVLGWSRIPTFLVRISLMGKYDYDNKVGFN